MITQSDIDYMWNVVVNPRLGVAPYVFGGSFDPNDVTVGTDCSGAVSAELGALLYGPGMNWVRQFWTGTFAGANPGDHGPFGGVAETADLICIASPNDAPADAVMIIAVLQDPDPSSAHMVCQVGGVNIEMGGPTNSYIDGPGATDIHDPEFNQWFHLPGPIGTVMQGIDYSSGRIPGADVVANGYSFVCRYLFDGSPDLPFKLLTAGEAADLQANGVGVVSNFESVANSAMNGFEQGVADAQLAEANHLAAGGPPDRPIYFSVDYDAPETDQPTINQYFEGVASVIGLARTGVYGGYWVVSRCFDAGVVSWGWQAEAWSSDPASLPPVGPDGDYLDPRANILQRNNMGFVTIDGVQCDVNQSQTADFGQWNYQGDQLNPEQADQLAQIWGALLNPITSQSPFRSLGEGAIWTTKDMPHNDDGMIHPAYVADMAVNYGDPVSIEILQAVASGDPTAFPDRAGDIALAKSVLAKVNAPAAPAVVPAVVAPAVVAPVAPVIVNPLTTAPMSYLHTITTLVGGAVAIGSYAVAHDIFSTPIAAAISSAVLFGTGLFNFLVKEQSTLGVTNV